MVYAHPEPQFCYYVQQDEERRQATMHIPCNPGERIEVDWAGALPLMSSTGLLAKKAKHGYLLLSCHTVNIPKVVHI